MMTTVSLQEAQAKLSDLIHCLNPGDEIVITENDQPVARLVPAKVQPRRKLGSMKGTVTYIASNFNATLSASKPDWARYPCRCRSVNG